jgi:hypothetical protein
MRFHINGRLLALPENIRLGWKWVEKANTQADSITATITAVKSFIVEAPGFILSKNSEKFLT